MIPAIYTAPSSLPSFLNGGIYPRIYRLGFSDIIDRRQGKATRESEELLEQLSH